MTKAQLTSFFMLMAASMVAQDALREYKVENLTSAAVVEKFKQLNPAVAVFDQPETNRLILKGQEADIDRAVQSLDLLDVEQKDVGIEFMLVEYHHGTDFDWSLDLTNAQFGKFNGIRLTTGALNGFEFVYNAISHLSPAFKLNLSALASENKAKVITNPHLVARAGGDASLKITENIQIKLATR